MVARLVRDQEAVGSNPATSTTLDSTESVKTEKLSPFVCCLASITLLSSYFFLSALASWHRSAELSMETKISTGSKTRCNYHNYINPFYYFKSTYFCGLAIFLRNFCFCILDNSTQIQISQLSISTCVTTSVAERQNKNTEVKRCKR